jgi:hypothetical protein
MHFPSGGARGDAQGVVGANDPIPRQQVLQGIFEVDVPVAFRGYPMPRSKLILHCSNDEVYQMIGLVPHQATTSLAYPYQAGVYLAPFRAQISVALQSLYRR